MAPTVGRSAPGDTARVTGATAHPGECDPARDWHGRRAVGGRAVAELALPVESPAECAAAAINATGVTAPRAYRGEDYPARHCHGHRAVGSRAVAEFALPVESPAERLAARV